MELVPNGSARGIRVTFKDYGFFVPTDSAERSAKLEGVFESNVFSKHDADHLIAEGVLAVEMGARAEDLQRTIHAHPTLSETVMEAAEVFFGHSPHFVARPRKR